MTLTLMEPVTKPPLLADQVVSGIRDTSVGVRDSARSQRLDGCELLDGSRIGDVDVDGTSDEAAVVSDQVVSGISDTSVGVRDSARSQRLIGCELLDGAASVTLTSMEPKTKPPLLAIRLSAVSVIPASEYVTVPLPLAASIVVS